MCAQRRTTASKNAPSVPAPAPKPVAAPSKTPKPTIQAKPTNQSKQAVAPQPSAIALRTESARKLFRESMSEMKKINWPDQQTTRSLTILVIGISVVLGILLGGIDFLLVKLLQAF